MRAVGEGEQPNLVVDAAAAGFPLCSVAQAYDHFVGVGLGLSLVDGDEFEAVGIELEDFVGSSQDAWYGCRYIRAIAFLPEEDPML